MKLWPFGKRKTQLRTTTVDSPVAEVREYYDSSRQERQGLAWFLAFATLIVTLLIVVGLFFGGRWLYNKIKHNDTDNTATTQQEDQVKTESGQQQGTGSHNTSRDSSASSNGTSGGQNTGGQSSGNASSTANTGTSSTNTGATGGGSAQNTPQATNIPATTPTTGDSSLPNTGPGNVLAIAALTALISGVVYRFKLSKRFNS